MQVSRKGQGYLSDFEPLPSPMGRLEDRCSGAAAPVLRGLTEMLEEEMEGEEPDFVGVSMFVTRHADQLALFETWAREGRYEEFSVQHYDWWMFPIDRRSVEQGGKYTVHENQIKALRRRPIFMKNYRRGVELLLRSWGWDLKKQKPLQRRSFDGHLVRLGKVLQSLELFGETELFESVQRFARKAIKREVLTGRFAYLCRWI